MIKYPVILFIDAWYKFCWKKKWRVSLNYVLAHWVLLLCGRLTLRCDSIRLVGYAQIIQLWVVIIIYTEWNWNILTLIIQKTTNDNIQWWTNDDDDEHQWVFWMKFINIALVNSSNYAFIIIRYHNIIITMMKHKFIQLMSFFNEFIASLSSSSISYCSSLSNQSKTWISHWLSSSLFHPHLVAMVYIIHEPQHSII